MLQPQNIPPCGVVDESCGPARALRAVWTARGQPRAVAHRLPTLSWLSPTTPRGQQQWLQTRRRRKKASTLVTLEDGSRARPSDYLIRSALQSIDLRGHSYLSYDDKAIVSHLSCIVVRRIRSSRRTPFVRARPEKRIELQNCSSLLFKRSKVDNGSMLVYAHSIRLKYARYACRPPGR